MWTRGSLWYRASPRCYKCEREGHCGLGHHQGHYTRGREGHCGLGHYQGHYICGREGHCGHGGVGYVTLRCDVVYNEQGQSHRCKTFHE